MVDRGARILGSKWSAFQSSEGKNHALLGQTGAPQTVREKRKTKAVGRRRQKDARQERAPFNRWGGIINPALVRGRGQIDG